MVGNKPLNIDTYITIAGIVFSVGGAAVMVNRLRDDVREVWTVITKMRDWQSTHEKEAADQRLRLVQDLNRIERDSVTKEEMRRDMEKVYGKLDDLSEKMDRYFQSKGN